MEPGAGARAGRSEHCRFRYEYQAALDAARFSKPTFAGCDVAIEDRFPKMALEGLSQKGHQSAITSGYSQVMGQGNAVMHDERLRVNFGASDPRLDGQAVPEEPPVTER